jgi:ankyrin repeat protein
MTKEQLNRSKMFNELLALKWQRRMLSEAIILGEIEKVKALLTQGLSINYKDMNDKTPLQRAIRYGHKEIVELLKQHGGK